ncbi:MAG: M10 family metallopeptidase C-terminal domain-containing protein, partial [Alphaproteobacteria bacterium]
VATTLNDFALPDNVERLDFLGIGGNRTVTGNDVDNVLNGAAGDDDLRGGGGEDLIQARFGDDRLDGGDGDDRLIGQGGLDTLTGGEGNDLLVGGGGDDELTGGGGGDRLIGAAGADLFIYETASDSGLGPRNYDRIFGFNANDGDRIDLSAIDADTTTIADDPFAFVESFSGAAGQLIVEQQGARIMLRFDIDGDGAHDGEILVQAQAVAAEDLIL